MAEDTRAAVQCGEAYQLTVVDLWKASNLQAAVKWGEGFAVRAEADKDIGMPDAPKVQPASTSKLGPIQMTLG